jgi:hypothetical protein
MAFRMIANIWANLKQIADRNIWQIADAGAPTSGTSGTGNKFAGPGSTYTNTSTGDKYINTNTKASPTWEILASGSFSSAYGVVAAGTAASSATTASAIVVSGALTTDTPIVTWKTAAQTSAVLIATATTTGISVSYATTVGTAGVLQYALLRAL